MKVFHCDHCRHLAFFENVQCVKCGHVLAFLPDLGVIGSLDPHDEPPFWKSPLPRAKGRTYRLCQNYVEHNTCNWAVNSADENPLCPSCRLTRAIPDLTVLANKTAWYKLEVAKRRLVYTLAALGLSLEGLVFQFLADPADPQAPRVLTGHADGLITVNIAEADDAEREKRRTSLNEPYRTLLGHLRHESGHFYFDKLVAPDADVLPKFRAMFGDDRADYAAALQRHYADGAPPNWENDFISAYATMHPWEDWAETWAHYLHMVDAMETASTCGLSLSPKRAGEPALDTVETPVAKGVVSFDDLVAGWYPVTYLLNNLNRGLGQSDAYPFVLSNSVVEKLRFVHNLIAEAKQAA
jgi:hypothetical protein